MGHSHSAGDYSRFLASVDHIGRRKPGEICTCFRTASRNTVRIFGCRNEVQRAVQDAARSVQSAERGIVGSEEWGVQSSECPLPPRSRLRVSVRVRSVVSPASRCAKRALGRPARERRGGGWFFALRALHGAPRVVFTVRIFEEGWRHCRRPLSRAPGPVRRAVDASEQILESVPSDVPGARIRLLGGRGHSSLFTLHSQLRRVGGRIHSIRHASSKRSRGERGNSPLGSP